MFYSFHPKSTANFLERGGAGCELRVTRCEIKNFSVVLYRNSLKFYPVYAQPVTVKHATDFRSFLTVDLGHTFHLIFFYFSCIYYQ